MSKKSKLAEGLPTGVTTAEAVGAGTDAIEADLVVVKSELTTVLGQLFGRPDLQGGDGAIMATRARHSLNGPVHKSVVLGDAIEGVLADRWESLARMNSAAAADTVVSAVRKRLTTVAAPVSAPDKKADAPVAVTEAEADGAIEAKKAPSDNPNLDRLLGYIAELKAPEAVVAALRRDIGGMGKALKEPFAAGKAKKAIAKAARANPGNEALLEKLG